MRLPWLALTVKIECENRKTIKMQKEAKKKIDHTLKKMNDQLQKSIDDFELFVNAFFVSEVNSR